MFKPHSLRRCSILALLVLCPVHPIVSLSAAVANPVIYAHRGLIREAPENTLAAFTACIDRGLSFELDVYLTRDGVPVVIHDATLDRTTNGSGRVTARKWAELKGLDAGSWFDARFASEGIPTLEGVFEMIRRRDQRGSTHIAINMKEISPRIEEKIVRIVERFSMLERVFAFGMDSASIVRFKTANPNFPTFRSARNQEEVLAAARTTYLDGIWLNPQEGYDPSPEEVAAVHRARKKVVVYLQQNEPARWRVAAASGVDAIATDYPREALQTVGR